MYTEKNYLDGDCTHGQFYAQFVTPEHKLKVIQHVGLSTLLASTDEHLNDIPLKIWDQIKAPFGTSAKMKLCDTYLTLSCQVCIAKQAAREVIYETNLKDN